MRLRIVLGTASLWLLVAVVARADRPEWEAAHGKRIAGVRVETAKVFDTSLSGQDHKLLEWANALHVVTRPHVVRREFRQSVGDPFDPRLAEECERNLYARVLFQEARVLVRPSGEDSVDVVLRTTDRWSLRTYPVLRSEGGITEVGLVLGERNLLGLGLEVIGSGVYSSDVSSGSLGFHDRRLLGSFWDLGTDLYVDELGHTDYFNLTHPFHSESVGWSSDLRVELSQGERRLFDRGEEVERLDVQEDVVEGFAALHGNERGLSRAALFCSRRAVSGDVRAEATAVGFAWALLRRRSSYEPDLDRIGPDEETAEGWTLQFGTGADLRALGAEEDRPFWRFDGAWAHQLGRTVQAGFQFRHDAFYGDRHLQDGRLFGETFGYWRHGANALAWRLGGDVLLDGVPYYRFNLGSEDRLRGYPARYQSGTRVLYGSIEERLFTQRRVLFLRLGAVAFVDVAAAWDEGERLTRRIARVGMGLGLRIGADPAGDKVTRVDLGVGSDSVQLSFSSGSFFSVARMLDYPGLRIFR